MMRLETNLTIKSYKSSQMISRDIFQDIKMPDHRLKTRLKRCFASLLRSPNQAFSKVFSTWADTKAWYRFIDNARVRTEYLVDYLGYYAGVISRRKNMIFAVSDTTEITLPKTQIRENFGYGTISKSSRSIFVHSTLAVDRKGVPIGLLHQNSWIRDPKEHGKKYNRSKRPIEEKESYKWIEAAQAVEKHLTAKDTNTKVVMICDRECDIYEYFEYIESHNLEALVRAFQNRITSEKGVKLWDKVKDQAVSHTVSFVVPRRKNKKERKTTLTIRYSSMVNLAPPTRLKESHKAIPVSIIYVEEKDPPSPEESINWRLITTLPIHTGTEAWEIAQWYKYRWLTEEFHLVLKSGCRAEKLQFETFERYAKALVILSQVSVELLRLRDLSRISPELPAGEILSEEEIKVLKIKSKSYYKRSPPKEMTIAEAVKIIGRMGGHLGRKHDGKPGITVLWRGWRDLQTIVDFFRAADMEK